LINKHNKKPSEIQIKYEKRREDLQRKFPNIKTPDELLSEMLKKY